MTYKRASRMASWLIIAVIAFITTVGILAVMFSLNDGLMSGDLRGSRALGADAGLWFGVAVAALAPWWALGAVAVQTHRQRREH